MSEAPDTEVTCALVLTRLFIEALDARDVEALAILVADAEIDGMASFEVRDGELTMFEVFPEMLRAAAR